MEPRLKSVVSSCVHTGSGAACCRAAQYGTAQHCAALRGTAVACWVVFAAMSHNVKPSSERNATQAQRNEDNTR